MRRFFLIVHVLTAVAHLPVALAFVTALDRLLGAAAVAPESALRLAAPWLLGAAASAALVVALRGRIRLLRWDQPISRWRRLLVEEPYFTHWAASVACLPLFVLGAPLELLRASLAGEEAHLGLVALGAYLIGVCVAGWAVMVRRRWIRVREIDVDIVGLAPELDGFRIAQMSDLHIGSMCPAERAHRWVDRVNALDVDLVALTGDYVTSGVRFHRDIADVLSRLRARHGAVAVLGNHDYFGEGEPLIGLLRAGGVTVLRNERTRVARGEAGLIIAGVDDLWTRRADVARTLAGWDRAEPLVMLAHDPALFPEIAGRGAALTLSGHTHWGQVAVPFLERTLNLSRMTTPLHSGRHRRGEATLWINPGLGTTGPPLRLGAAPEITVLRLRAPRSALRPETPQPSKPAAAR